MAEYDILIPNCCPGLCINASGSIQQDEVEWCDRQELFVGFDCGTTEYRPTNTMRFRPTLCGLDGLEPSLHSTHFPWWRMLMEVSETPQKISSLGHRITDSICKLQDLFGHREQQMNVQRAIAVPLPFSLVNVNSPRERLGECYVFLRGGVI